jgi:hypothetical protein
LGAFEIMGFVTFVFIGVTWFANGSVQIPIVMTEASSEACFKDYEAFVLDVEMVNAKQPKPLSEGYAANCIRVISSNNKKDI